MSNVSATDMLLEAAEYLCKLGENLKSRSLNLKDKRINKDKLKNVHSVQKAVDKILVICELSKKSLEHVETGVKKVLDSVHRSLDERDNEVASANTSRRKSLANVKIEQPKRERSVSADGRHSEQYQYLRTESQKVKIPGDVPLKHYLSCKVYATKMPTAMCDNYPVYCDCKLLRSRRTKAMEDRCRDKKNSNNSTIESNCVATPSNSLNIGKKSESLRQNKRNGRLSNEIKGDEKREGDDDIELNTPKKKKLKQAKNVISSSCSNEEAEAVTNKNSREENEDPNINKNEEIGSSNKNDNKNKNKSETESISKEPLNESISEVPKLCEKSNGDNTHDNKTKLCKPTLHSNNNSKEPSTISPAGSISECLRESTKCTILPNEIEGGKEIEVDEDDINSSSNETSKGVIQKTPKEEDKESKSNNNKKIKLAKENEHKTMSPNDTVLSISDSDDETDKKKESKESLNEPVNDAQSNEIDDKSQDNETKLCKPMLKCVDINKLLAKKNSSVDNAAKKPIQLNNVRPIRNTYINKKKKIKEEEKKEDFWEQKRKEVRAFKAKEFHIKVSQLPKFTKEFMNEYNITRIIKNNEVIIDLNVVEPIAIEIQNENDKNNPLIDSLEQIPKNIETVPLKELDDNIVSASQQRADAIYIDTVKNALLNDSDSDNEVEKEGNCEIERINTNTDCTLDKDHFGSELPNDCILGGHGKGSDNSGNSNVCNNEKNINDLDEGTNINKESEQMINIRNVLLEDSDDGEGAEHDKDNNKKNKIADISNEEMSEVITDKVTTNSPEIVIETENKEKADYDVDNTKDNNKGKFSRQRKNTEESKSDKLGSNSEGDSIKNTALKENTENSIQKTPKHKRKRISEGSTPNSKRRHIMESMEAKKMLLNYSSSSDTEDEQLRNALKEIKDELLNCASSPEGDKVIDSVKEFAKSAQRRLLLDSSSNSSSEIDIPKKVAENKKNGSKGSASNGSGSEDDDGRSVSDKAKSKLGLGSEDKKNDDISQVDGTMDDKSQASDEKMGRSKASGSRESSQTQDPLEKDIDGLSNLKTLNKRTTRRNSTSTDKSEDTANSKEENNRGKTRSVIDKETVLEAESNSSDGGSDANSGPSEDLPEVPMTSLNGDGAIHHLAKEDLLEESDDASTGEAENNHTENSENDKEEEEDDDDNDDDDDSNSKNVKSKRRKALAISSDSDGDRKKNNHERRLSESDSGEDSSGAGKRSKRKKKASSDASGSDSSQDTGKKKRRRRIKVVNDSDASGSGSENEGKKHGRKNIRKVMGKDQLEEATKKAARKEKERIARITERQILYNNMAFDESGKPDEVVLDKVVLDFDPETKEPLIQVDSGLVKKLKPHQANGIKFMWDASFESVKRIKKDKGSGCILAHCMGLGKTLQVVALTHTLLAHRKLTGVRRVLVVCPLSTVLNWVNEFRMWLEYADSNMEVDIYELSRHKQNSERAYQLQEWLENGGVCVLGYEMFRNLSADNNKKFRKKMLKSFQESLVDPGPDMVVCDEGHLLKNEKTSLSQSMNKVKTLRRIVLTGTPLQNNLKEYYCMVQFVKPNLLGKYNEYLNRFVNPITNGQYTDSTEQDIRVMKRRSHVLHKMLDGAVQRRDYGVLAPFLPPKHEYVLFITLTDVQVKLYQHYLENYSRRPQAGKSSGFLFPDFQSLQRIWTHPLVLKYNSERYEIMQQKKRDREEEDSEGSLADFIDDESTPEESTSEESSDDMSDVSDDSRHKSKKKAKKNKAKEKQTARRGTRANPEINSPMEEDGDADAVVALEETKNDNPTEWWIPLVTEDELDDLRNSHKLVLLFDILRQCEAIGDKLLVFSQSLYSLDLIEHYLGKIDEATQENRVDEKLGGHVGSWSPGIDYFRLDGSTSCENRSIWCKNFNKEDNPRARLFLISTRAGGLGINLVAANRVVIFDVSWNPSHDVQSIFRVYRFGQKKPCYVYRFLAMGTMEEKIYERQVTKQAISKRVIDEQQIDRHYAENDLAELYRFEPTPSEPRPVPSLPKDRLFAEMLKEHDKQIYKFHEHDSLLENKEEETLTEEERKAAWDDFENEKNRPPPVPFNSWPMHNGMAGMMAQQQQQLAYAALANMLRKEQPNLSDQQLANMLPLIYNANPTLMQKINEMYKYSAQSAGMMNPAMMNPVMNAGAMGGSSGLQYEPPWQRHQQQQQQLRLQQLMQQQQSMNQKYYAGGLGSRDPVAMALQQQRAREMLLGEGRPRGRPPLQVRAPSSVVGPAAAPVAAGDVVDLDSD